MNKPSPLVSKSPFVSEQYTALWEAIEQCKVYGAFSYSLHALLLSIPSVVDMLNRLGYKIVKVQE